MRRRALASVALLAMLAPACTIDAHGSPAPVAATEATGATTPLPGLAGSDAALVALRVRPAPSAARPAPRPTLPDGSRRLFPDHRVVAFYGAAGSPVLGVLGTATADGLWPRLARQASAYRHRRVAVLPAYELIAFVATSGHGNQGNYSTRVADSVIATYARAARRHHALLLLDVQPGRGSFLHDAKSLRRWLLLPYVGLALDPEWKLYGGELPLTRIGHTDARSVNAVSRWLAALTTAHHLPQKLFVVHEFTADMVRNKAALRAHRDLATVFNVDGFGSRPAKIGKYDDFARGHRFPLGFKLFYDKDVNLLGPAAVLKLHPAPVLVEYQ
ncbi:MAG: hypothetical protein JO222_07775 [Frankiales bacterium]|nr:hypothetical protein [Frankiales bacterium]